jgi:hypothetical protein
LKNHRGTAIGLVGIEQGHQEVPEDALVDIQRGLGQAAVLAHPGAEGPEQRPTRGRGRRRHRLGDHSLLSEEPEEPGAGHERLPGRSPGVSHARLCRERDLARLEPWDQLVCGASRSAQPVCPPGKRSERRIDTDRPVSSLVKPGGNAVDIVRGRASAEPVPRGRRVQMIFEHGDLPSVKVASVWACTLQAPPPVGAHRGEHISDLALAHRAVHSGEAEPCEQTSRSPDSAAC